MLRMSDVQRGDEIVYLRKIWSRSFCTGEMTDLGREEREGYVLGFDLRKNGNVIVKHFSTYNSVPVKDIIAIHRPFIWRVLRVLGV